MRNEEFFIPHSSFLIPPHSSFLIPLAKTNPKTAHLKDYTGGNKEDVEENDKSPGYPLDMDRRVRYKTKKMRSLSGFKQRRQKTEVRIQKTEGRRQKTGV